MSNAWTFRQLGGARRVIVLDGAAAPHGRPRRDPVVTDGVKLRRQRVFYSGNDVPTTHIFGVEWKDWELKGRWGDRFLGRGGTTSMIETWKEFVRDAQEIEVSWGDLLRSTAIVDDFEVGRESPAECEYTIRLLINEQTGVPSMAHLMAEDRSPQVVAEDVADRAAALERELAKPSLKDMASNFVDSLAEMVGSINTLSASLVSAAQDFDDFVGGTIDQLERLRSGCSQMRTAVLAMERTVRSANNDIALMVRSSDAEVPWAATRSNLDVLLTSMLALLAELDRQAEVEQRGRMTGLYVARLGDTWESISILEYGGPDGAGKLREANGVRYGEPPVPGRAYQVPSTA